MQTTIQRTDLTVQTYWVITVFPGSELWFAPPIGAPHTRHKLCSAGLPHWQRKIEMTEGR